MNNTMISFLTNEQTPERLQEELKKLRQKKEKEISPKKDRLLVVLGTSFLMGLLILLALLVISTIFLY